MHFTQSAQERGLPTVPVLVGYPWSSAPWRSLQGRGRAMSLARPPAGPLLPGLREGICLHCSNSSAPSKIPRAPLHCPLLLDRLLHTHPKTSFCLSSSQISNLDLTTVANSSAPPTPSLLPGERGFIQRKHGNFHRSCALQQATTIFKSLYWFQ